MIAESTGTGGDSHQGSGADRFRRSVFGGARRERRPCTSGVSADPPRDRDRGSGELVGSGNRDEPQFRIEAEDVLTTEGEYGMRNATASLLLFVEAEHAFAFGGMTLMRL